jgi:hypothetical protein
MTARTARALSIGMLLIGFGLLAVDLAAMVGWLPIRDRSGLWMFAFVFFLLSRGFRRQSRTATPVP